MPPTPPAPIPPPRTQAAFPDLPARPLTHAPVPDGSPPVTSTHARGPAGATASAPPVSGTTAPPGAPARRRLGARRLSVLLAVAVLVLVPAAVLARRHHAPASEAFHVPAAPTGLVADHGRVWVALPAAGVVWVLDASGRRTGPPIVTGGTPARLALDARWAWVADTERAAVVRVPRAGGRAALRIPAGPDVTDVADAAGGIWAASAADGAVRRLHGTGWTTVAHGVRPVALAADARHVVAADAGAGALLRLRPPRPPVRLGGMPVDVALAGDDAWVADAAQGVVRRVDLATGRPDAAIRVGGSPIAVAADARAVYVVCRDDRTLVRLDPRSGAVRERSSLGVVPAAVALDAAYVWVAGGQSDVIRVAR